MRTYFALFFIAAVSSLLLAPLVIRLCRARNWLDQPSEERKIHRAAIPRLGGIGIFLSIILAIAAMLFYENRVTHQFEEISSKLLFILIPAVIVFILGLVDDLRPLRARTKFLVQLLAAALVWYLGFRIESVNIPGVGLVTLHVVVGLLITVIWVVAVTNAFNFIDGMDGLAAGISFFCAVSVLVMGVIHGNPIVPIIAAPMAGALLGFLPFNWHPARLFMGDGGSYFLGFVLATLAVMSSFKTTTMVAVAVPIALVGIPLLDTTLAVTRRFIKGQPLFVADGDHIHHRLLKAGMHPRMVVILLYLLTVFMGGMALLTMMAGPQSWTILIPLALGLLAIVVVRRLGYKEFDELLDMFKKAARFQRQVIGNQVRIRRFIDEMNGSGTAVELFGHLSSFLHDLGFDALHVEVYLPRDEGESVWIWQWGADPADVDLSGQSWRIRIPLRRETDLGGYIYLLREVEKEKVLFQMATLLDAFSYYFSRSLFGLDPTDLERYLKAWGRPLDGRAPSVGANGKPPGSSIFQKRLFE